MRRLVLVLVVLALAVSGGTAAAVLSRSSSSPGPAKKNPARTEAKQGQAEESGVHGGPIDRFHNASTCNLVDVSKLSDNWTRGDYVSAVVAAGEPTLVPQAAHSDCGKPLVAMKHRGPP
jgi:hypothetical protein